MSWHHEQWEAFGSVVAALGTLATAIVTGGLWLYTARLYKTTEKSVAVAQQAAQGLPLIERAYVYITLHWTPTETGFDLPLHATLSVKYQLRNYGRTPARVTTARIHPMFSPTAPHHLPKNEAWNLLPMNAFLGSNEKPSEGFNSEGNTRIPVSLDQYEAALRPELAEQVTPKRNLYLVGDYTFYDVLGDERTETFCFGPNGYRYPESKLNRPERRT